MPFVHNDPSWLISPWSFVTSLTKIMTESLDRRSGGAGKGRLTFRPGKHDPPPPYFGGGGWWVGRHESARAFSDKHAGRAENARVGVVRGDRPGRQSRLTFVAASLRIRGLRVASDVRAGPER